MNNITLIGRLVETPELRQTPKGTHVVECALAVDRDYKNESGERPTDFIPVIFWRGSADFVSKYMSKGSRVAVVGQLWTRKYLDKNNNKRTAYEVVAQSVYFADGSKQPAVPEPEQDIPF